MVAGSHDYRAFEDYLLPAETGRDIGIEEGAPKPSATGSERDMRDDCILSDRRPHRSDPPAAYKRSTHVRSMQSWGQGNYNYVEK
jgi:hypothetical protein